MSQMLCSASKMVFIIVTSVYSVYIEDYTDSYTLGYIMQVSFKHTIQVSRVSFVVQVKIPLGE